MSQKKLEELQALEQRLQTDIRRSRNIDPDGLSRNSPLVKNYEQVQKEIKALKESVGETETVATEQINEMKITPGTVEHMSHAILHHHMHGAGIMGEGGHPHYHFHHMNSEDISGKARHHYLVVHKHPMVGEHKEAHHFSIHHVETDSAKATTQTMLRPTHIMSHEVKHHGKLM